ncbi:hypothetical protein CPB84DRAFT_1761969, partial [Gymnopilus junonius]
MMTSWSQFSFTHSFVALGVLVSFFLLSELNAPVFRRQLIFVSQVLNTAEAKDLSNDDIVHHFVFQILVFGRIAWTWDYRDGRREVGDWMRVHQSYIFCIKPFSS